MIPFSSRSHSPLTQFHLICSLLALFASGTLTATAQGLSGAGTTVEGGAFWFGRNDVRIPGDGGTRFDLRDLIGNGPEPYIRLYSGFAINERHFVRLLIAPLEAEGSGTLSEPVQFEDAVFAAGASTKALYQFNTYRLTYRYMFHQSENWQLGGGAALLVRDAKIRLEQDTLRASNSDTGLVPLLHLYVWHRLIDQIALEFDIEGLAASQGRAIDASLALLYRPREDWTVAAGYRTLEGGVDNEDTYAMAWIHHAFLSASYAF